MVVYTGGSSSVVYGYESTFGTAVTPTDSFGLQQKVTGLSLNTSQIILNKLGQVEPTKFAFGQQQGSVSLGFVFDSAQSYKIFDSLYGTPSGTTTKVYPANASIFTGTSGISVSPAAPKSLTTRIQVNAASVFTRTLKGCIVNSLGISTSIGETVNGTIDMAFAEESTADITSASFVQQDAGANNQPADPYTFAHGELKIVPNGGSTLTTVAEIQDVDVTYTSNAELLYGIGSHHAQSVFRKVFDIGGRFRTSFKDKTLLQYVIDQSIIGTETETIAEDSNVGLSLTFTNGTKNITLEFGGVSLVDHSETGVEPVEPVFEEINWKAKYSKVSVTS